MEAGHFLADSRKLFALLVVMLLLLIHHLNQVFDATAFRGRAYEYPLGAYRGSTGPHRFVGVPLNRTYLKTCFGYIANNVDRLTIVLELLIL